MSENTNLDKQFTLSLAALVILVVGGVVLGLVLARESVNLGLNLAVTFAVLLLFAAVAYIVVYSPLHALLAAQQKVAQLTQKDELTGLLSRTTILERLERELSRAWRSGEPIACALVDVDRLRKINDDYGTIAGDSALRSVGGMIEETCRQYDSAGRYGSEEFLIVLPATEIDDAARMSDRLRRRIEENEFACHGEGFHVTVSIGVTQADLETAEKVDDLIRRADEALGQAKADGRNRVSAKTTLAAAERSVRPVPASSAS